MAIQIVINNNKMDNKTERESDTCIEFQKFNELLTKFAKNLLKVNKEFHDRYVDILKIELISTSLGIFRIICYGKSMYRCMLCKHTSRNKSEKEILSSFIDLVENNKTDTQWWKDWMDIVWWILSVPPHINFSNVVSESQAQDIMYWCNVNHNKPILGSMGFMGVYPLPYNDKIKINMLFSRENNCDDHCDMRVKMIELFILITKELEAVSLLDMILVANFTNINPTNINTNEKLVVNLKIPPDYIDLIKDSTTILDYAKEYAISGVKKFETSTKQILGDARKDILSLVNTSKGEGITNKLREVIPNSDEFVSSILNIAAKEEDDEKFSSEILTKQWITIQSLKIQVIEWIQTHLKISS